MKHAPVHFQNYHVFVSDSLSRKFHAINFCIAAFPGAVVFGEVKKKGGRVMFEDGSIVLLPENIKDFPKTLQNLGLGITAQKMKQTDKAFQKV